MSDRFPGYLVGILGSTPMRRADRGLAQRSPTLANVAKQPEIGLVYICAGS